MNGETGILAGIAAVSVAVLGYLPAVIAKAAELWQRVQELRRKYKLDKMLELATYAVKEAEKAAADGEITYGERKAFAKNLVNKYCEICGVKKKWLTELAVNFAVDWAVRNMLPKTNKKENGK